MWPRKWKTLFLLVPASAVFLTACPDMHKRKDPANSYPYAGIWVNADLYGAYRETYKSNSAQFCADLRSDQRRYGIDQEPYGHQMVVVDSWLITSRGEVLVYNPLKNRELPGYREAYWRGNVDQNGYFKFRSKNGYQSPSRQGQYQDTSFYFHYAADARLFLINNSTMKVWSGNNSREYVRTEDRKDNQEMSLIYTAAAECFSTDSRERPGHPNVYPGYPDVGQEYPQGAYPPREGVVVQGGRRGGRRRVIVTPPTCPGSPGCAAVAAPGAPAMPPPPPPVDDGQDGQIPPYEDPNK